MQVPPQIALEKHRNSDAFTAFISMHTVLVSEMLGMLRMKGLRAGASSEPKEEEGQAGGGAGRDAAGHCVCVR